MSHKVKKVRKTLAKRKLWQNKDLNVEFGHLNDRFFDGNIRAFVTYAPLRMGLLGRTKMRPDNSHLIEINSIFKGWTGITRTTLLHEMGHVKLLQQDAYVGYPNSEGHGSRFQAEIDRLYKIGAYDGEL